MILIILVGGDARDLGVRSIQVVRGAGLVSPGPGGEGGVVLGAQQEAGAGPRAELPGVEDRSHHHHLLLRPGLRAVIVIAAGLGEADAAVPGGGNSLASPLQSLSKSAKINLIQMMFRCYMCHQLSWPTQELYSFSFSTEHQNGHNSHTQSHLYQERRFQ